MFDWIVNSVMSSTLGKTLVNSAVGAVINAGVSAVTGGDPKKAAIRGAALGGGLTLGSEMLKGLTSGGNTSQTERTPYDDMVNDTTSQAPTKTSVSPSSNSGLLGMWNNMTPTQGKLLGGILEGGAKGYAGLLAQEEASKQLEKEREFERERMANVDNRFFVQHSGGRDWNQFIRDRRLGTQGSAQ